VASQIDTCSKNYAFTLKIGFNLQAYADISKDVCTHAQQQSVHCYGIYFKSRLSCRFVLILLLMPRIRKLITAVFFP
jgi:hypothetical protein